MIKVIAKQMKNATRYSFDGVKHLLENEFSARVEVYCFLWMLFPLIYLKLPIVYLLSYVCLFLILLAVESLNTAIEVIIDKISPEISSVGKHAKDLGSFAVMCLLIINVLHLGYILTKVNLANVHVDSIVIISLLTLFAGIYYAIHQEKRGRISVVFITTILAIYGLGMGIYMASNYFTGNGFDHKVLFHLKAGLDGAGIGTYWQLIMWMSLYVTIGLVIIYICYDILGAKKHGVSKWVARFVNKRVSIGRDDLDGTFSASSNSTKRTILFSFIALTIAMVTNPLTLNIFTLAKTRFTNTIIVSDYEFYIQPSNLKLTKKKNIVVIYLEGLERTYLDKEIFPQLTPNLLRLEAQNINFTDVNNVYSTEWTIAGMSASQCGVPMYTPSQGNTMNSYDQFMPNALCLGDVLKRNGYNLEFLNGGSLEFAGKGKFYTTHGFETLKGRKKYKEDEAIGKRHSGWGVNDDILLDDAFKRFVERSNEKSPFGLFLLTLDTHPPKGHNSEFCSTIKYLDGKNAMLNAVHCADKMVNNFVEKIKESPYADDTIIIIASDHLSMRNEATPLLIKGKRRDLLIIMDLENPTPLIIDKPSSKLDMAPTILSLLGMKGDSLGFGRNLLSEEPTLIETWPKSFNKFLRNAKPSMEKEIWGFPNLSQGLTYNPDSKQLNIGERWVSIPILMVLDSKHNVEDLDFYTPERVDKRTYLTKMRPKNKPYLWVDLCKTMKGTQNELKNIPYSNEDWCATSATGQSLTIKTQKLEKDQPVFADIFSPI